MVRGISVPNLVEIRDLSELSCMSLSALHFHVDVVYKTSPPTSAPWDREIDIGHKADDCTCIISTTSGYPQLHMAYDKQALFTPLYCSEGMFDGFEE